MSTVAVRESYESRLRGYLREGVTGTPGRMRVYGAVAVVACLVFGVVGFIQVIRLDNAITAERSHARQLVRLQEVRTSLVLADAEATNAFLVGGLPPAATVTGYSNAINNAAGTLAEAANAGSGNARDFETVNTVLAKYTGLVESARANNRQGFPIGAAYLRQASTTLSKDALPALESLVNDEKARVLSASSDAGTSVRLLILLSILVVGVLIFVQVWLSRTTRRTVNPPLLLALVLVAVAGAGAATVGRAVRNKEQDARSGPYAQTVALATIRIDTFDAKSAESLSLIARGSGQDFDTHYAQVTKDATNTLAQIQDDQTARTLVAYQGAHDALAAQDTTGRHDQAVASATGTGRANVAFSSFESASNTAINAESRSLSDDLASARRPLLITALMLLIVGLGAAFASRRGISRRLEEYR